MTDYDTIQTICITFTYTVLYKHKHSRQPKGPREFSFLRDIIYLHESYFTY